MKKLGQSLKATAVAAAMLVGVGMAGEANALTVSNGDLVLVMIGNNTQLLQNLGQTSSYFGAGTTSTINLTPSNVAAAGGTSPVRWALFSFAFDEEGNPSGYTASSVRNRAGWTSADLSQVSLINSWNTAAGWSAQHNGVYPGGPTQLISSADGLAYTNSNYFGTDGSMASGFPLSTESFFGSTLAVLQGVPFTDPTTLAQLGSASLSGDGLTLMLAGVAGVPAVPIPAAVILFGTGLAGLVGVARRKMIAA